MYCEKEDFNVVSCTPHGSFLQKLGLKAGGRLKGQLLGLPGSSCAIVCFLGYLRTGKTRGGVEGEAVAQPREHVKSPTRYQNAPDHSHLRKLSSISSRK